MRLLIMGPPGVGKGTQAKILKEKLRIIHLSTGEILRREIVMKTEIGEIAKKFIDAGKLVPDKFLLDIISERIARPDCSNGYLLDGFPRTIPQAIGLNTINSTHQHHLNAAINLTANEKELIKRILIRKKLNPDRSDDKLTIIKKRQQVYWKQTAPLIDFYTKMGILKNVNGLGTIKEITKLILEEI